jgi:hypothetical protein
MANNEALFSALFGRTYRLPSSVAAIPASFAGDGRAELGTISHLPADAELTFCGAGFNESTCKVRWEGQSYFVFLEEIASAAGAAKRGVSDLVNEIPRKRGQNHRIRPVAASQVA